MYITEFLKNSVEANNSYLIKFVAICIVVIISFLILKITHKILMKYFSNSNGNKMNGNQITSVHIIYSVFRFFIIIFCVIIVLDIVGINVTGFVAGLGIVGAIGGLAVQDLLKDLIAGTTIATDKFFSIGDTVEWKGITGVVLSISMRVTKIKSYDGSIITIQNHLIDSVKLVSSENIVSIPLSYDLDRKIAFEIIDEIVKKIAELPEVESAYTNGISSFEDSSINYCIRYYCNPTIKPKVAKMVNVVIINELDKASIAIPFKQIDIHQFKGDI